MPHRHSLRDVEAAVQAVACEYLDVGLPPRREVVFAVAHVGHMPNAEKRLEEAHGISLVGLGPVYI